MSYHLEYWNWPRDNMRFNPFSCRFDDMPSALFKTVEEARTAVDAYIATYNAKGGESKGGYNGEDDLYWIRHEVGPDRFRFTTFAIRTADEEDIRHDERQACIDAIKDLKAHSVTSDTSDVARALDAAIATIWKRNYPKPPAAP